ncbi:hypothetical protein H4R24_002330 [Coemansia sp. RSA 988]|nr:hypothetical protein H4R24_002330 [Coemansia sp. RSA 988]
MTIEAQAADAKGVSDATENLWETVLREVGSTKAIATKKVLILGDANSGKTGVVTQLFQASLSPQIGNGQDGGAQSMSTGMGHLNEPFSEVESAALSKHELALTYSYMDVRDEDNEETVARLGIYQLASDRITDRELLRFVMDAKSFPHAAAVIVLDWSRPWRFVKSLLRWINVLSHATEQVCSDTGGRATSANSNWTVGRATVDECRERLERFLQEYSENESPTNAAKAADVLLPLGNGVLSANLGLPLIVVCTKSDTMGVLERERGFSEEDFDYVQQVLRAVCLRFGAALIYTSTHNPATFATLYHYLVHRLLSGPATLPALGVEAEVDIVQSNGNLHGSHDTDSQSQSQGGRSRAGSTVAQENGVSTKPSAIYPFRVRASVVDRDVVFVPGGWDSATKIGYLREPFDVNTIQDAWCFDETRYQTIVDRALRTPGMSEQYNDGSQEASANNSLLLMYAALVAAPKQRMGMDGEDSSAIAAATAAAGMANKVAVEDEQVFLAQLFEEQQEQMALEGEDANDSRTNDSTATRMVGSSNKLISSLLRNLNTAESLLSTASDVTDANTGNASDEDELDSGSTPPMARQPSMHAPTTHRRTDSSDTAVGSLGRASSRTSRRPPLSQSTTDPMGAPAPLRRKITIPTPAGANPAAPSPGDNAATSNEELTSFFQNLLGRKGGASSAASSNGKGSPQQPPPRPLNTSTSNMSRTGGQKDVQADLERWKAQLKRQKE